jgi:hypothetical protein
VAEIVPIIRVDGHRIAGGRPGARTREMQQAYRELVRRAEIGPLGAIGPIFLDKNGPFL